LNKTALNKRKMNVTFLDQDGDKIEIKRKGKQIDVFLDGEFVTRYEDGLHECRLWYSDNYGLLRITGGELCETDIPIQGDMISRLLKILPTLEVQEQVHKRADDVDIKTQFRKSMMAEEVKGQLEHVNISQTQQTFTNTDNVNIESSSLAKEFDRKVSTDKEAPVDAKYSEEAEEEDVLGLEKVSTFRGLQTREHRANSSTKRETAKVDDAKVVQNFTGLTGKPVRKDSLIKREVKAIRQGTVTRAASIFGGADLKKKRKTKKEPCALQRRKSSRRFSDMGIDL